jgi:uncharacterized protein YukJ
MTKDPWTDPDPQPGDFDAFLDSIDPNDPDYVQVVGPSSNTKIRIVVNVDGEDAERLERIATQRGQDVEEVISDLLREAERHAA